MSVEFLFQRSVLVLRAVVGVMGVGVLRGGEKEEVKSVLMVQSV